MLIPAHNELDAFKNKVTAAEKSKKITGEVSGSLKKSADRIKKSSSL